MIFKDITLEDKSLFDKFEFICSDYVFSYIYMFADLYKLRIYHDDRTVIIHSKINKPLFYMPLGDTEYGIELILNYCKKNKVKPFFAKIPLGYIEQFKNHHLKIKEDRSSFDYIYRTSDLVNYEGKDFRTPRNNLSNFFKTCTPDYTDSIYEFKKEFKLFILEHYDDPDIINPTIRILDSMEDFNFKGGIVWDSDNIQGFCIYENVSPNTILSHVELTNNEYRGAHAYMINEMSKRVDVEYINKEDDVGMQGLRRFKESYNPCTMFKKHTACIDTSCIE